MRCVYADYTNLRESTQCAAAPFANLLKSAADIFCRQQVICGYSVSSIAFPPNEILIDDVVLNVLSDLDRIMAYHPVETPTKYKFAAYVGFWWQRVKPISCKLHDYTSVPDDRLRDPRFMELCKSLNEIFITDVMLSLTRRHATAGYCNDRQKLFTYSDLKDSLHYFLRYRHYTAQGLELFLKGFDTCPLVT